MEEEKIIVTGGAGFIGSHTVVELINAGYTPIIIDNFSNSDDSVIDGIKSISGNSVKLYIGDCQDEDFLKDVFKIEKTITGSIHFAAFKAVGESVLHPLKYYQNNIDSLLTLMRVMKHYEVADLVFSSSCTVYGQPESLPVTEDSPLQEAASPYGETKKISERVIEDETISNSGMKSIFLRYFNPIGAHPSSCIGELPIGIPNNLVPFITQTAAGIREKLTINGGDYSTQDGTCVRDYIHVVDLAKAHVKGIDLLKKSPPNYLEILNLGMGVGKSVMEVIHAFEQVTDQKLNYEIGPRRKGDIEKIYASVEKAEKILNWKAELSLEEALKDAWNWQVKLSEQNK